VALKSTERLSSTIGSLVHQYSAQILRRLGGCVLHATLQMPKADYRYNSSAGTAKVVKHIRQVHKLTWNERKGDHTMYMSAAAKSPVRILMIARQHILPTLQPKPGELSAPSQLVPFLSPTLSHPRPYLMLSRVTISWIQCSALSPAGIRPHRCIAPIMSALCSITA
jgi:hypothetical protein